MLAPFSTEMFFEVFARYNRTVWPMQFFLVAAALAICVLVVRGSPARGRWVAAVLAGLWVWMALAYHFAHFTAINPLAWGFGAMFLLGATWMVWVGVVQSRLQFGGIHGLRGRTGVALIVFALAVYPVLGALLGHRYPAVPTFGLPCPTTIFTIGVLLLAAAPVPRSLFVVPLLWSAIGSLAVFSFGVVQDLGLLVAGVIGALACTWRRRGASAPA